MDISELVGKTLAKIEINKSKEEDDYIIFCCEDSTKYKMYHKLECSEGVWIDDINGEIEDLIGTAILMATESSNSSDDNAHESVTWTFYKIATVKGYVDIKWYGESNGYYSESVDFEKIEEQKIY
mgnify:CR=1 FL=1